MGVVRHPYIGQALADVLCLPGPRELVSRCPPSRFKLAVHHRKSPSSPINAPQARTETISPTTSHRNNPMSSRKSHHNLLRRFRIVFERLSTPGRCESWFSALVLYKGLIGILLAIGVTRLARCGTGSAVHDQSGIGRTRGKRMKGG